MKRILFYATLVVCASCAKMGVSDAELSGDGQALGTMSVRMEYETLTTKAQVEESVPALDSEKLEKKVDVIVFDQKTGRLAAYKSLSAVSGSCQFSMPAGKKTIYAVVNGPDLSSVTTVSALEQKVYDMSKSVIASDGFFMVGKEECDVVANQTVTPTVSVRRLAARVVLRSVSCSLPAQYGKMKVECAFLGNAYSKQTVAGAVDAMVNVNGYAADGTSPIGKSNVTGSCPEFFYRSIAKEVATGGTHSTMYYMYSQPNKSNNHTCLYLLATIGGTQYYYRVPLNYGLNANVTYSVDVDIINLGSELPPDGTVQKGDITAVIKMTDWVKGEEYDIKF